MTTRPDYYRSPSCAKEHKDVTTSPLSTPSPTLDPLCPRGYVGRSVSYKHFSPSPPPLSGAVVQLTKTFSDTLTFKNLQQPKIQRTFSPKKFYRKQQVLVHEPSVGKYVYAIVVDFEEEGELIVVSGGFYQTQKHKTSWEVVEPYDSFCVPNSKLPNTTQHSMRAITSPQARAEISQFRRGQENTEFFAYLDQELPRHGVVHYGQLKAPTDAGHCGHIVGPKATHFAELTHKYNLLFVWHDRHTGLFKVWGREHSDVMDALRQLLFHKLKCKAEDDESRLRDLIRAAETRYLNAENFPRRYIPVSVDI